MQELHSRSPVRALVGHLGGGLGPGQVGFIVAKPGVGKSAMPILVSINWYTDPMYYTLLWKP